MDQNQAKLSWNQLLSDPIQGSRVIELCGLSPASSAYAIAQLVKNRTTPVVVVTDTTKADGQLMEQLGLFVHGMDRPLFRFPAYNVTAFKPMAYHS
jgi:hypothetical protein